MNKLQNYLFQHTNVIYLGILLFAVIFIVINNGYTYFWYDEGYTLSLINHSYAGVWEYSSRDVHPPLYYYLLKIYMSVTGGGVLNARFFSAIPVFLMLIAGYTMVRKIWGDKVAIIFMIMSILTPAAFYMASEIRMYSWCMYFVFMAFLYAYQSYTQPSKINHILFVVFSLAGAYTHYYGLLAIFFIYFVYFVFCLCYKREKIFFHLLLSVCFLVGYSPWLYHMISQLQDVSSDYWIGDGFLAGMIEYFFPVAAFKHAGLSFLDCRRIEVMIPVFFFLFLFINAIKSNRKKISVEAFVFALVSLFPVLFGIIYSFIFRPVFVPRYVCCSLGAYFLCVALFISLVDTSKKINKVVLFLFFAIFFMMSLTALWNKKIFHDGRSGEYDSIVSYVGGNNSETTAILYKENLSFPFPILFPEYTHICLSGRGNRENDAAQLMINTAFEHIGISSITEVDSRVQTLYVIDKMNSVDSARITKYFEIEDYQEIRAIPIYKLLRKNIWK